MLPPAVNGDVMILAGDIVTLRDYEPLDQILRKWKKPVLYVTAARCGPILTAAICAPWKLLALK